MKTPKKTLGNDALVLMFPEQLQSEPDISRNYTSSFDGESVYKAAQNQNSCFYEEGIKHFYGAKTKEMVTEALSKF